MALKKFMEVAIGQTFKLKNDQGAVNEYVKLTEERISCCKAINAALLSDQKQRIQVLPLIEVEVND
jgi:hypothetical protein